MYGWWQLWDLLYRRRAYHYLQLVEARMVDAFREDMVFKESPLQVLLGEHRSCFIEKYSDGC